MTKDVSLKIPCSLSPEITLAKLLDARRLHVFHGPSTSISKWKNGKRSLSFSLDASGSPISLGSHVTANVMQSFDGQTIRNSMRLKGWDILSIESSWMSENNHIVAKASINVHVFPPLKWIAEAYIGRRATSQMRSYADSVTE